MERKHKHLAHRPEPQENHIKNKQNKYKKSSNWFLVGDSHINSNKLRMVEKVTEGKLFCKGFAHPKEGRAYCSSKDWPNAKYPGNNHTEMLPKLLIERPYTGGIILCPGNDISNLTKLDKAKQKIMAEKTAINMLKVAERALEENPTLEKLVLMEYPPRADSEPLAKLSGLSNQVLRDSVDRSRFRAQIVVGSMANLNYANKDEMIDRFGPTNSHPRFDGVHLRGSKGAHLYTESIMAAVRATEGITKNKLEEEFIVPRNTVKPQKVWHNKPVSTQNKFNSLNY